MIQAELKELFKFLFDFFKLVNTAHSSSVIKWRLNDFNICMKWCKHVEDIYKRVEAKPSLLVAFGQHVQILFNHWTVSTKNCEHQSSIEFIRDASARMRQCLLMNRYLNEQVKTHLISLIQNEIENQINNDKVEELMLLDHELNQLCVQMCRSDGVIELDMIDNLLAYSINNDPSLEFLKSLFDKLRVYNSQSFRGYTLRLLNRRFDSIYNNPNSVEFFKQIIENDTELTRAYFCYIIFVLTSISSEFHAQSEHTNHSASLVIGKFDIDILIDHLLNAIELSKEIDLVRAIKKQSKKSQFWQYLIERIKSKH